MVEVPYWTMALDLASRWVVIGNSGSGKSMLAERVGMTLQLPIYDLVVIHWHRGGQKRDEADAQAQVAEIAAGEAWVIEGVYGWQRSRYSALVLWSGLTSLGTTVAQDYSQEDCGAG